jgi:predicted O-methyltransferase YrrM
MSRFWSKAMSAIRQASMELLRPANAMLWKLWRVAPLASAPKADAKTYLALWERAKAATYPEIDELEMRLSFRIDTEWLDSLAMQTQIVVKQSVLSYAHGRLLYALVCSAHRRVGGQPLVMLETGTARGFSALCMAKALEDSGNGGFIVTMDVLPHEAPMYWNCIADVEGPRSRKELLANYRAQCRKVVFVQGDSMGDLSRLGLARVHLAFLDGVHTERYVQAEVRYLADRQESGDQIVFDDFSESQFPGVVRAARAAAKTHGYSLSTVNGPEGRAYAIATRVERGRA